MMKTEKSRDLISRADAIEAVAEEWLSEASAESPYVNDDDEGKYRKLAEELFEDIPSAEAEPTVIRSKTLMPTKDFKEWAKRVRETNPNAVVIPCDAEVVSAESAHGRDTQAKYALLIRREERAMTRQDVTWVLELIKNRDARTDAERDAIDMAIEALQTEPKTGKWIVKHGNYCGVLIKEFYCDQCGKRGGLSRMFYDPEPLPNFCGHCGADMRGGSA